MIQAMTSGHAGSMSTLHANVAIDALNRLETLAMMSKVELPLHALRSQISSAIDLIVQVTRFNDGRRALTQISEVLPLGEDGHYRLQEQFSYKLAEGADGRAGKGGLVWCGLRSSFADEPKIRILRDRWNLTKKMFEETTTESGQ
jgi:pilus assembly protein CpaF